LCVKIAAQYESKAYCDQRCSCSSVSLGEEGAAEYAVPALFEIRFVVPHLNHPPNLCGFLVAAVAAAAGDVVVAAVDRRCPGCCGWIVSATGEGEERPSLDMLDDRYLERRFAKRRAVVAGADRIVSLGSLDHPELAWMSLRRARPLGYYYCWCCCCWGCEGCRSGPVRLEGKLKCRRLERRFPAQDRPRPVLNDSCGEFRRA